MENINVSPEDHYVNQGYVELCISILERAFKDYVSESIQRKREAGCNRAAITKFIRSPLCDFYCTSSGVDPDYYRYLFEKARQEVKKKKGVR